MINVYVARAFCLNLTGGNKAGVVIHDKEYTTDEKIRIAADLGYSETAFLARSKTGDFKLEYFTPTEEVPMCGHATIGTFAVLSHLNMLHKPAYTIETKSGLLHITIRHDGLITMEQNPPFFYDILETHILEECFDTRALSGKLPVRIVSTGLKDIMVPISSPEYLRELAPDFTAISKVSRNLGVIGIHAFSLMDDGAITAVCRNFAPLYGIPEESATGTSNCALACYLFRHGIRQNQYIFEQGHNLNLTSRIIVNLDSWEDTITNVSVGGYGCVDETQILQRTGV